MLKTRPMVRGIDNHGSGEYGAPRGDRTHNGMDFAVLPGSKVESVANGVVTKIGYPYADALQYRYVQVTDNFGFRARYFYVDPEVSLGDRIAKGDVLGKVQCLNKRYPGITPHVHFEVKNKRLEFVNPIVYLAKAEAQS